MVNMSPINPDDHHETIDQFRVDIANGLYNDYDGSGVFATATLKEMFTPGQKWGFSPSNFEKRLPVWATHVVWYNK